ncbi:hypothetical protein QE152_g34168 [Popillia japonica]
MGKKTVKTAKGVKKYVIDKKLSVADYVDVVEDSGTIMRTMYIFRSELHTMYTELRNKVALSPKDDKRYILPDKFHTLAWGNFRIVGFMQEENLRNLISEISNLQQTM